MKNNYIKKLLKLFPNVASGRKNFENYDKRVKKKYRVNKKIP